MAPFGDHNVYLSREDTPIFKAEDFGSHTIPGLYRKLDTVDGARTLVIPHVGGAVSNWDYHDPAFEVAAEIYSVHGSFEAFGELALRRGLVVSFVAGSDSHTGQIGGFPPGPAQYHFTHGGLTAARVSELTREAVWEALAQRRVYATTGPRIFVDFTINGEPMGSVLQTDQTPVLEAEVLGTAPPIRVDVVKNGHVIHTWWNEYQEARKLTLLWSNRVEPSDLQNFDRSLWSYAIRSVDWQGHVTAGVPDLSVEKTCSFDPPKDKLVRSGAGTIAWTSMTRGDWDGITLNLPAAPATLELRLGEHEQTIDVESLPQGVNTIALGDPDRLLVVQGEPRRRRATLRFKDDSILRPWNDYYLRVLQADGEMAWSTPIWITRPEPGTPASSPPRHASSAVTRSRG
jgi:hypothetical protein